MPQHSNTMRNIFGSLFQHLFAIHRISADHFVGRYSYAKNFVMTVGRQRRHHNMSRQQSRPPPFGHGNVDQRHDGAAQIKNTHQVGRAQRHFGQNRPIQYFLNVQNRKAQTFAPAAKHAVLRLRPALLHRTERFQQAASAFVRRKRFKVEKRIHRALVSLRKNCHANRRTALNSSSDVKGLVTYPSAPCCSPQNLSLAVSREVTRMTGIVLYWLWPFNSRQTWKPFLPGITTSSRITLGCSKAIVSSTRIESCRSTSGNPSRSK